jgi:hypothetical protein
MPRRRGAIRKYRTKRVITRSIYDHIQGDSVKTVAANTLPSGCCALIKQEGAAMPFPCTRPVSHVEFEMVEGILKLKGYCRTHKPKRVQITELPKYLVDEVNVPTVQEAKIRRMEDAMYIRVVPASGSRMHLVGREEVKVLPITQWVDNVSAACGKAIKRGYVPTPSEEAEYDGCQKCQEVKSVQDEDL